MIKRFPDKLLERIEKVDRERLKQYYHALVLENRYLEKVISQLEGGVIVLGEDQKVKIINTAAEKLLSVSSNKLKGYRYDQCPFDSLIIASIQKVIKLQDRSIAEEIGIGFPKEQILQLIAVPIEENAGWLIEIHDVTQVNQSRRQRIQAEKMKALVALAAALAHELGNPLNSIAIHLQLLDREINDLPKKKRDSLKGLIGVANNEIKRLDQIVTHFLQATAPIKPRLVEIDIKAVINEALEFIGPELEMNKIKVVKKIQKNLPKVYLDYIQVRQVILNIIKNALEAMPGGGLLNVAVSVVGDQVKLSFADNGVGVPNDQLDKIFEPYYTTKQEGSGLGLMIVHRIVREHGGHIEVDSSLGKGTRVSVFMPQRPRRPKLLTEK